MVNEQLKKLINESDDFVNKEHIEEEQEVSWIDAQSKLSDDEKLTILKWVARYYYSDEFKSLVKKFSDKCKDIDEDTRKCVRYREKTEANYSFLDRCIVYIDAMKEVQKETANETFKNYLQARIDAQDSMVINKKGSVAIAEWVEVLVDSPIFTDTDLFKAQKEIYISIDAFMKYTVSLYDMKWKLDNNKEKTKGNQYQPYE